MYSILYNMYIVVIQQICFLFILISFFYILFIAQFYLVFIKKDLIKTLKYFLF